MEWSGYETRQTPLLCFCGTEGIHRSIAFPSFWSYWPLKTLHYFILSQLAKRKQRIVHPPEASNRNCSKSWLGKESESLNSNVAAITNANTNASDNRQCKRRSSTSLLDINIHPSRDKSLNKWHVTIFYSCLQHSPTMVVSNMCPALRLCWHRVNELVICTDVTCLLCIPHYFYQAVKNVLELSINLLNVTSTQVFILWVTFILCILKRIKGLFSLCHLHCLSHFWLVFV